MSEAMRAVDANVLLRYFLKDIPAQAEKARGLIESEEPVALTAVALAEVGWTLAGPRYRLERIAVATHLLDLVARENILTIGFDKAETLAALMKCTAQVGAANLGDALIAACARSAGIEEIYSFDRRFARAGLTPLTPP